MIKIRYRDPNELSPGLHAEAERRGRSTTVYLLSGLTKSERRAALRRLRLSARMGYCPELPAAQLALAVLADRIRTGVGQAGAVFRLHPAGSTLPVMVVSGGAIAFLLLSAVSIRVLPNRPSSGQLPATVPPVAAASAVPLPGTSRNPAGAGLGGPGQAELGNVPMTAAQTKSGGSTLTSPVLSAPGAGGSQSDQSDQVVQSGQSGGSSAGGSTQGSGGTQSGSGGTQGGSGSGGSGTSTPAPAPSPTDSSTPGAPAPAPSPAGPAPASTINSGGICMNVGSLGVCLNV